MNEEQIIQNGYIVVKVTEVIYHSFRETETKCMLDFLQFMQIGVGIFSSGYPSNWSDLKNQGYNYVPCTITTLINQQPK